MPNYFLGRDKFLDTLIAQLTSGETVALSAEGKGGVGKTTLAVALAYHQQILAHFKDGVLWSGLGPHAGESEAMSVLASWAMALGQNISGLTDLNSRKQAVNNLIGQRALLLVIDDVWELDLAIALRCGGPNCCHVLTTRNIGIARQFAGVANVQTVTSLDEDPSYNLLKTLAPEACEADPETSWELAKAVGGLPLALELLGGYLADTDGINHPEIFGDLITDAFTELSNPAQRLKLAKERLGTDEVMSLQDTLALSLADLLDETQAVFYALGAFAPKPERFSREAAEAVTQADGKTLAKLVTRNLVEVNEGNLVLHQVLADLAKTEMDKAAIERHRAYYLNLAKENWQQDWRQIEAAYGQIRWAWERITGDEELVEWVYALRNYQSLRGLWRELLKWAETGLNATRSLGQRKEEGVMLAEMGGVYDDLGQYEEALGYFKQALIVSEELQDEWGISSTLNSIGLVYINLDQPNEALECLQRSFVIARKKGFLRLSGVILNNAGRAYELLGQLDQSLKLYRQALSSRKRVGDCAGVAQTLSNIGIIYQKRGRLNKALRFYKIAYHLHNREGDLPGQIIVLRNMGAVYKKKGQVDEAVNQLQRALDINEKTHNVIGVVSILHQISQIYFEAERREEALVYFQQLLPILEELENWQEVANTLNSIGFALYLQGQIEGAMDNYQRALSILEDADFPEEEKITRFNMAILCREEGRLTEAVAQLKQVVELNQLAPLPDLGNIPALLSPG